MINQNATNEADCSLVEECDRTAKQNIALATAAVASLDQSTHEAERGATKQTRAAQYAYWHTGTLLDRKGAKARCHSLFTLRASVHLETLLNDILLAAGDGCACLSSCVLTVPHSAPLEKANARHALQPRQTTTQRHIGRSSTWIGISHFPA